MNGRVYFWLGMLESFWEWMTVQLDSEKWEWLGDVKMDVWGMGNESDGVFKTEWNESVWEQS